MLRFLFYSLERFWKVRRTHHCETAAHYVWGQ